MAAPTSTGDTSITARVGLVATSGVGAVGMVLLSLPGVIAPSGSVWALSSPNFAFSVACAGNICVAIPADREHR